MNALIARTPLFVRKLIVDFLETGLAAILGLTLVLPTDTDAAKRLALTVAAALGGALISAARRAAPDAIAWVAGKLGTTP